MIKWQNYVLALVLIIQCGMISKLLTNTGGIESGNATTRSAIRSAELPVHIDGIDDIVVSSLSSHEQNRFMVPCILIYTVPGCTRCEEECGALRNLVSRAQADGLYIYQVIGQGKVDDNQCNIGGARLRDEGVAVPSD